MRLAFASEVEVNGKFNTDGAVSIITESARIFIPMDELVDFKAELERLNKEKAAVQKDLDFVNNKLNNQSFVAKAPQAVVEGQKEAQKQYLEKIKMLEESIEKIEKR